MPFRSTRLLVFYIATSIRGVRKGVTATLCCPGWYRALVQGRNPRSSIRQTGHGEDEVSGYGGEEIQASDVMLLGDLSQTGTRYIRTRGAAHSPLNVTCTNIYHACRALPGTGCMMRGHKKHQSVHTPDRSLSR